MRKRPEHYWKEDIYRRAYYFDSHDSMLYSVLEQDNRRAILEENEFFRNNPEMLKTLSFGKMQMRIPDIDRRVLGKFLGLDNLDKELRRKAWQRFLDSPMSDPYRVVPRERIRYGGSKKQIQGYFPTKETSGLLLSPTSLNELPTTQEQEYDTSAPSQREQEVSPTLN